MLKIFWIWGPLGALVTGISLVSLIERWGEVNLQPESEEIIQVYRSYSNYFFYYVFEFWSGLEMPNWLKDGIAIWALFSAVEFRALSINNSSKPGKRRMYYDGVQGIPAFVRAILLGPIQFFASFLGELRRIFYWKTGSNKWEYARDIEERFNVPAETAIQDANEFISVYWRQIMVRTIVAVLVPLTACAFFYWDYLQAQAS